MGEEILKILDKKVIELDGVKVEVELRMVKNCWKKIVFKPYARFYWNRHASPIEVLKKKYKVNKK